MQLCYVIIKLLYVSLIVIIKVFLYRLFNRVCVNPYPNPNPCANNIIIIIIIMHITSTTYVN